MRYVLELSYKGTNYHGWQIQKNAHTVQAEINNGIQTLLKQPVETIGSGRTDTGVHAEEQFLQFDFDEKFDASKFIFRLNAILPPDIFIKNIYAASDDFSVRFNAIQRSYVYKISLTKNPFLKDICCFYFKQMPDVELMNKAAKILLQHTDFQSFSKYHTAVNHFDCTITIAYWEIQNEMLTFHISANRFLRGMVRTIVGTLLEVGQKNISIEDFEQIILKRDRIFAKASVPPQGLFLSKVKYPEGLLKRLA